MAGLGPAIHAVPTALAQASSSDFTAPFQTDVKPNDADGRDEPGHDGAGIEGFRANTKERISPSIS